MPRPLLIYNQSDYLIRVFDRNSHIYWQTVQIQISWLLQKPTDLDLHCLLRPGMLCLAREGLSIWTDSSEQTVWTVFGLTALSKQCEHYLDWQLWANSVNSIWTNSSKQTVWTVFGPTALSKQCEEYLDRQLWANSVNPNQIPDQVYRRHLASLCGSVGCARLTGDQEVAGSTPARSATFFQADWSWNIFLWSFSPFHWFKKGSCQFLVKEYAQVLLNCFED